MITIERETTEDAIGALEAYEAVTGRKSAVLAHLRAALAAQPAPAAVPLLVFNACAELEAEIDVGWTPAARAAVRRLRAGLNMITEEKQ